MKRLLIIIPPYFEVGDLTSPERAAVLPTFTIPYGVLSLQAYLNKYCSVEHEFRMLDLNVVLLDMIRRRKNESFNSAVEKAVHEFRPDIVGVSALFNTSAMYIEDILRTSRSVIPDVITVCGGGLPSAAYATLLDSCHELDAVCKGEGEIPLKDLLESQDPMSCFDNHKSWITKNGVKAGKVPAHTFITDLDEIPQFDYSRLDLDNYNSRSIDKRYTDLPKREMAIHTSRGCPFLCVFCSNPSLHGKDVRMMSIGRVIADVTRMRDEFGMTVLLIEDDHFFHDKDRAKDILRALAELNIRVEFPNGVAVYAIDDEVASLFKRAGVSAVILAVESGSDFVLNRLIKKPLRKKLIIPAVQALRNHDVRAHVFVVIGLPGEQDEHRQETLDMLLNSGFDWVHVNIAMPIYGSRLYDICVENNYIEDTSASGFVATKAIIRAPGVDPVVLEEYAYETQLRVNFVENFNIKNKIYDVPINYMKNVVAKYPNHAFGHYYLGVCYQGLDMFEDGAAHLIKAAEIFESDPWWASLASRYGIPAKVESAVN
jgi:anaerobic magnesium-protoporphyrin IX monomethyl ester cyclase